MITEAIEVAEENTENGAVEHIAADQRISPTAAEDTSPRDNGLRPVTTHVRFNRQIKHPHCGTPKKGGANGYEQEIDEISR